MMIMKSRTRESTEGTDVSSQGNISNLREKENYKYLEILKWTS